MWWLALEEVIDSAAEIELCRDGEHRRHLTALPRVSLNGDFQSLTYTAVFLSGAPFALWNRFQQVNAA